MLLPGQVGTGVGLVGVGVGEVGDGVGDTVGAGVGVLVEVVDVVGAGDGSLVGEGVGPGDGGQLSPGKVGLRLVQVRPYATTVRDDGATLDDLREAVTTLEDAERIARRVFGGAHPLTTGMEEELQDTRAALHARETPRGDGVEDDDDDEDGWETVSSDDDEEAPTTEAIS